MSLPNFQEALKNLGANDDERALVLGLDDRTVRGWRAKEPRIIHILAAHPVLIHALAKDACTLVEQAQPVETAA